MVGGQRGVSGVHKAPDGLSDDIAFILEFVVLGFVVIGVSLLMDLNHFLHLQVFLEQASPTFFELHYFLRQGGHVFSNILNDVAFLVKQIVDLFAFSHGVLGFSPYDTSDRYYPLSIVELSLNLVGNCLLQFALFLKFAFVSFQYQFVAVVVLLLVLNHFVLRVFLLINIGLHCLQLLPQLQQGLLAVRDEVHQICLLCFFSLRKRVALAQNLIVGNDVKCISQDVNGGNLVNLLNVARNHLSLIILKTVDLQQTDEFVIGGTRDIPIHGFEYEFGEHLQGLQALMTFFHLIESHNGVFLVYFSNDTFQYLDLGEFFAEILEHCAPVVDCCAAYRQKSYLDIPFALTCQQFIGALFNDGPLQHFPEVSSHILDDSASQKASCCPFVIELLLGGQLC